MPTEVIGMYGAVTGGNQDAIASVDIPQDGVITGIDWDVRGDLDADGEEMECELSFIATNQITSNDVRGRISSASMEMSITTSGIGVFSIQKFVGPIDLPVAGGERLYIHVVSTAGVTGAVRVNIHLEVGSRTSTRRSARR